MSINKFILHLSAELINSVNNNYRDNYDYNRFGKTVSEVKQPTSFKTAFISLINKWGYFNDFNNYLFSKQIENLDYPLSDFFYLHNTLQDEYSKKLLVKIVAYLILKIM